MKVLNRYLYASLLGPFFFCLIAFASLIFVEDLFSSLNDFIQNKAPLPWIIEYYRAFLPGLLILTLPATVLFSSLYTLLKFSRNSELTVMQACGVPLWRLYIPFLVLAFITTGALYLITLGSSGNAKAKREEIIARIRGNPDWQNIKHGQVYEDRSAKRIWYLQTLDLSHQSADEVEILQLDESGNDVKKYFAHRAEWKGAFWTLYDVHTLTYDSNDLVSSEENTDELPCPTWNERPLDMAVLQIRPDQLSFQDLQEITSHLNWQSDLVMAPYRTQLYWQWTYPLSIIVLTLFALVHGTSHSRKNAAGGVFNAIFILIAFLLVQNLFFTMGKGDRLSPLWANVIPLILFLMIGIIRIAPNFGFYPLAVFFGKRSV